MIKHNMDIDSSYIIENAILYHMKLTKYHSRRRLYKFPSYRESSELYHRIKESARLHKPLALTHKGIRAMIYCVLELSVNPLFNQHRYHQYSAAVGNLYNRLLNVFTATMSKKHKKIANKYFKAHGMNPRSWVYVLHL